MSDFSEMLPISIVQDPSLDPLSANMASSYATANQHIAQEHQAHFSLQREHIAASRLAILNTAEKALQRTPASEGPRRAIVLGAGNCIDIPVAELAASFDKMTLVDAHIESVKEAVSRLPGKLIAKINVVGADISGVAGEIGSVMEQTAQRRTSYAEYARSLAPRLNRIDPAGKPPDLGEDYTFACSQLVLSQLGGIPFSVLGKRLAEQYEMPISNELTPAQVSLLDATTEATIRLQKSHVEYLARLVRSSGTVHLADTYAEVKKNSAQQQLLPMVMVGEVQPVIDRHFENLTPLEDWYWPPRPNRLYYVIANSLAPRGYRTSQA